VHGTTLDVELDEEGLRRRSWAEFSSTIKESALPDATKTKAVGVFDALIRGEERAHRTEGAHQKPHELGTVDTLVDIVGVIVGFEELGVEKIHASAFPSGRGMVKTEHGMLPVPALATIEIMAAADAPIQTATLNMPPGETVTPTGAALMTQLASFDPVAMTLDKVGYGLGGRDTPGHPNVLGIWLGESPGQGTSHGAIRRGGLSLLETNIDDMSGEAFGYAQERLFEAGALDVWMTPMQMKKNRPGILLSVLIAQEITDAIARILLTETSTLGVRVRDVERYEADRSVETVATSMGDVLIKVKRLAGSVVDAAPEYESCKVIAQQIGKPLSEVMARARTETLETLRAEMDR
jgi:hypothetical protein